jgi:hypothetical protein
MTISLLICNIEKMREKVAPLIVKKIGEFALAAVVCSSLKNQKMSHRVSQV